MADKERHLIKEFGEKLPNHGKKGKIGIKISETFAKTKQGQILLWTTCNLTCRLKDIISELTIILPKNIEYSHHNYIPYNDSKSKKLQEIISENLIKTTRDIDIIFKDNDFNDELDAILLIGPDCSTKAKCGFIKKVMVINWLAFIGDEKNFKEFPITNDKNPFGSLVAGCLGVGEIFKFLSGMKSDAGEYLTNFCLSSYDFSCYNNKTIYDKKFLERNNPKFPNKIDLKELVIVGCGAVGHAFSQSIYAIENIRGTLTIIDRKYDEYGKLELIESTNLARYILANNNDLKRCKASLLAERLGTKKEFHIDYSDESFQDWSNSHNEKIQHIVSCVDNNKVRHDIQEKLPRKLHGGSTQDLRVQISTYDLTKNIQCLKCYNPINSEINDDKILEKLSKMGVSERTKQCEILELDYEKISKMVSDPKCGELDMNALKKFVSLWSDDDFSVNFVSTLSGVLLASEIIKTTVKEFEPKLNCKPYSDLFFSFWHGKNNLSVTQSNPKCWCNFGKITPRMIYKKTNRENKMKNFLTVFRKQVEKVIRHSFKGIGNKIHLERFINKEELSC